MRQYFIIKAGRSLGPFNIDQLKYQSITIDTLVWYDGIDGWINAGAISDLQTIILKPPPPVPQIKNNNELMNDFSYRLLTGSKTTILNTFDYSEQDVLITKNKVITTYQHGLKLVFEAFLIISVPVFGLYIIYVIIEIVDNSLTWKRFFVNLLDCLGFILVISLMTFVYHLIHSLIAAASGKTLRINGTSTPGDFKEAIKFMINLIKLPLICIKYIWIKSFILFQKR